jgi:hypothetical protein
MLKIIRILFLSALVCSSEVVNSNPNKSNDSVYNQIAIVKGTVSILNHPQLGKTAANGFYLVFQRNDCEKCLIATTTDLDGKYQVFVGRGKYKVIVRNPSPPEYDMLAPDQARLINASSILEDNIFNINVVLQSNRK